SLRHVTCLRTQWSNLPSAWALLLAAQAAHDGVAGGLGGHLAGAAVLAPLGGGERARAGDGAEHVGAARGRARVAVGAIDAVEPELRAEPFGPLEVVHQAPVVVAAHVGAAGARALDLLERAHHV